jgi:hypothetical protein
MTILAHTPWWVFAVLAVLIVTGIQALRPRVIAAWRLLIVPAIFIAWGIASVSIRASAVHSLGLDWLAAVVIGGAIGYALTRSDAFAFEADGRVVHVPGSPVPLLRNSLIFAARYTLAVAAAFAATAAAHAELITLDVVVSGLASGYFVGWIARAARAWRTRAIHSQARVIRA